MAATTPCRRPLQLTATRRGEFVAPHGSLVSSGQHTPGPVDLAEAARCAGVADERLLAAIAKVPRALGGREDVGLFEKDGERLATMRSITAAYFVHLYGKHGRPLAQAPTQL
jgi:hypothetical protein